MRWIRFLLPLSFGSLLTWPSQAIAALKAENLRCEYRENPVGVDSLHPRMSWKLVATPGERDKRQSAYRVLVASTRGNLSKAIGDQWDSGKVMSSETLHIAYAGKQPESDGQYFWKVRVWDESGEASNWSEPATWTTGLLNQLDWQAKWITDPSILVPPEAERDSLADVESGYSSVVVRDPNTVKWVGVDLGQPVVVDTVRLFPASRYEFQEPSSTMSFPEAYRIEVSNQSDFSDAKVVAEGHRARHK
jgi:hypothetical protein